ncbi:MAG: acetylxylan esterase [Clostridiaceae bacterium]|jgi:cephalosporin-C deacetylase|nr:acetylxylan esterase [Clostridiaceae bacterium]
MTYLEDKIAELSAYLPPLTREADFDLFWETTRTQADAVSLDARRTPCSYPIPSIAVSDIQYSGFDGTPIHGWLIVPTWRPASQLPCLIHYHGFTGNRGLPCDFTAWTSLGVAVLSIDCRQQAGDTGTRAVLSSGCTQSVVCQGILDPKEYYFRAVYMDCLRAIDFAAAQPEIDPGRIILEGGSQGGALGMAVSALDDRPWLAMVDVPSNSLLHERVSNAHGSFSAVTDYLKIHAHLTDQVFRTLSYFDTMNLADRIRCPLLASVALNDTTCPAKFYFASYNRITSPKEIAVYPFNGHEGGRNVQLQRKLQFLAGYLDRSER